ncbi:aromatic amino acid transaminase [Alteriqipengyuania sp. WL0013]|uniref:amino acid aminotransferase n=1 Tax=Alteriqipengyuania sp. WL0013 TaxID=3110773 RepID=UPI002C78665C|nr:aromatic amino acid transaminase [Alteriqipengyuania sp. WL0013]MEB3415930.1 aromatic amino acid transaminase [Alteriqipengyuania sp. WL0013]
MLENLSAQAPDALLALIKLYGADTRPDKIDLGVGVYRTDDGATPVFRSIKGAERQLVEEQDSKSYLGPEGDTGFVHALKPYIFGKDPTRGGSIEGMQTPGGTGAVRLALAVAQAAGVTRGLMGTPSWPNHAQILKDLGLELAGFNHATAEGEADLAALEQALAGAGAGDALLLHASCHNPTGVDYTMDQWERIAALAKDSGVLVIIDSAYQGLGQGMEKDAAGLRLMVDALDELLICYSCDKNFGLYRDRVGALYIKANDDEVLERTFSNCNSLARASWSMPPDHGAAAVRHVLRDSDLTRQWQDEVDEMRARMRSVRAKLAAADNRVPGLDLKQLEDQNGLFAMLKLDKDQIERLRKDHGVYMAGSGRINIAGLTSGNVEKFIAALEDVTS